MKSFLEILYIIAITLVFCWLYWFWTGGWITWVK